MPVVTPDKLVALQRNAEDVRNVRVDNSVFYASFQLIYINRFVFLLTLYVRLSWISCSYSNYDSLGPRQNFSYRCTHCHQWHHLP